MSFLAPVAIEQLQDSLQFLTQGTVAIHIEEETGRASCVCLQLER